MGAAIQYIGVHEFSTDSTTYTAPGASIGAIADDREVAVVVCSRSTTGQVLNGVTVAGESASIVGQISDGASGTGNSAACAIIEIAEGTTADIVATFATTQLRAVMYVYRLTGIDIDSLVAATASGPSTLDLDIATSLAGGVIAGAMGSSGVAPSPSWVGLTQDASSIIESVNVTAASATTSVVETRDVSLSWSSGGGAAVAVAFGSPKPTYTSGASFTPNGNFNVGTWDAKSNGLLTYEVVAATAAGDVVDSTTGASGVLDLSSVPGQTVYLLVRASNSGGYDDGDNATRVSSYGSADDGYYELATVTADSGADPTYESVIAAADATLTLPGAAEGPTTWLPTAKVYDGVSDRDLIHSGTFNWRGEWTMSAWVWLESLPTFPNSRMVFNTGNTYTDTTGISIYSGTLNVFLNGGTNGVNAIRNIPLTLFPLQQWRLLTVTRESSGLMRVYSGATEVTSTTLTDLSPLNYTDIYVGGRANGDTFWEGRIAHAGLWTTALDASDVALLTSGPTNQVTYLDRYGSTSAAAQYSFADVPLGDESSDRIVFVIAHARGSNNSVIDEISVAGTSLTKLAEDSGAGTDNGCAIYAGVIPTGTEEEIVVTYTTAQARCVVHVLSAKGYDLNRIIDSGVSASGIGTGTLSFEVDNVANGLVIAAANTASSLNHDEAWTGIIERDGGTSSSFLTPTVAAEIYGSAATNRAIGLTNAPYFDAFLASAFVSLGPFLSPTINYRETVLPAAQSTVKPAVR